MIQLSFTGGRKMTHFRLSNPTKENFKNFENFRNPQFRRQNRFDCENFEIKNFEIFFCYFEPLFFKKPHPVWWKHFSNTVPESLDSFHGFRTHKKTLE